MSQIENAMVYASRSNWASRFPTLYILDICAVNATKLSRSQVTRDSNKADLVSKLRFMDRPHHYISYMCALMEKVANADADEDLERNILRDMAALRNFFRCARVIESDDFVLGYMRELRNVAPELGQPNYLTYLEQVNGKHELRNAVSVAKRYQKAQELVRDADALGVPRQHPLVLITLACLYRNQFAIDLMKFKAQQNEFKAANALADIIGPARVL